MKDLTKYIQENILKSTGAGKDYFPKWSKWFSGDQWKTAARLFCDFYDIYGKTLRSQIEDLFFIFLQMSNPDIKRFRFVEDYDIDKKLKENTKLSYDEIKSIRAFNISMMDVYLIIESDENFWLWKRNTQVFERIDLDYPDLNKYLSS